jgi:hypothetical protein
MRSIALLAAFVSLISTSALAQPAPASVAAFSGRWQVVDTRTGRVQIPCHQGQLFVPTTDGKYVDLSFGEAPNEPGIRYIVLQAQADRVMMFIEGEDRVTDLGDPVVWWAMFNGPDEFTWRRTDWPVEGRTPSAWRRCRAGDT